MTRVILALSLATIGTIRDEGHCLDQRVLVLTEQEAVDLTRMARRGEIAEARITELKRDLATAKRALAASKDECAAALEAHALLLTTSAPVCDCSEWSYGLAGAGVGMLSCGTFWLGARL